MLTAFRQLTEKTFQKQEPLPAGAITSPSGYYAIRSYLMHLKRVEICYGSRLIEYMVHPSFAHLECKNEEQPVYRIEAFSKNDNFYLKADGVYWIAEDVNSLKRKIFVALTNQLHGKSSDDWLTFIHGSAVSYEGESLVLSSPSGAGKSTLAALLCSHGMTFLSDDYVPIDNRSCFAHSFPAALSVKEGALPLLAPLYERLRKAERYKFRGGKSVRYLPFSQENEGCLPLPVKALVFVNYNSAAKNSLQKLSALEAIRRFNEEAWIVPSTANARIFLKWFPELEFYELVYSETEKAIEEILTIVGKKNTFVPSG